MTEYPAAYTGTDYLPPLQILRSGDHSQLDSILGANTYVIESHNDSSVILIFRTKPRGNRRLMWDIYASQNRPVKK